MLSTRGREGYVFGLARAVFNDTMANVETGRSWTATFNSHERDARILSVNGDVITMLVVNAFRFDVFNEQGRLDAFNRGAALYTLKIDTNGTLSDVSDDEVEFGQLASEHGPRTVRAFCEDAVR